MCMAVTVISFLCIFPICYCFNEERKKNHRVQYNFISPIFWSSSNKFAYYEKSQQIRYTCGSFQSLLNTYLLTKNRVEQKQTAQFPCEKKQQFLKENKTKRKDTDKILYPLLLFGFEVEQMLQIEEVVDRRKRKRKTDFKFYFSFSWIDSGFSNIDPKFRKMRVHVWMALDFKCK